MQLNFLIPSIIIFLAFFWSGWHYYRDSHKPEPILHLTLAIIFGLIASKVSEYSHIGIENLGFSSSPRLNIGFFTFSILGIGLIEELCKFIPFLICTRFKEYNELIDGIIYSSMIGIGFALEETFFYASFETQNTVLISRAAVSPLTHALFSSLFGYYHFKGSQRGSKLLIIFGIFLSSFVHGLYDFFSLLEMQPYPLIAALIILLVWVWRILKFKKLSENNK